ALVPQTAALRQPSTRLEEDGQKPPLGGHSPAAFAFDARVVAGDRESLQECKCHVVLANGGIIWRVEDEQRNPVHVVAYDHVASMVYSHGHDPLWNGPDGPTPVVRVGRGPFGVLGFLSERDWLSLRVMQSRLRFVVLRFDDVTQARSAINALEERTGRRIE